MSRSTKGHERRVTGHRGASLVEYSLVFTFLAVLGIGAAQWLTRASRSQVDNQAMCVSARPAPASCQKRPAIVPTTTTLMPTTTVPPPPTTAPPTTAPPATTVPPTTAPPATTVPPTTRPPTAAATFTATKSTAPNPRGVTIALDLKSGSTPVAGATVRLRFVSQAPGGSFETTVDAVSDAGGRVTYTFTAPYTDTTAIVTTVVAINSDPPATTLPSPADRTVTFP